MSRKNYLIMFFVLGFLSSFIAIHIYSSREEVENPGKPGEVPKGIGEEVLARRGEYWREHYKEQEFCAGLEYTYVALVEEKPEPYFTVKVLLEERREDVNRGKPTWKLSITGTWGKTDRTLVWVDKKTYKCVKMVRGVGDKTRSIECPERFIPTIWKQLAYEKNAEWIIEGINFKPRNLEAETGHDIVKIVGTNGELKARIAVREKEPIPFEIEIPGENNKPGLVIQRKSYKPCTQGRG